MNPHNCAQYCLNFNTTLFGTQNAYFNCVALFKNFNTLAFAIKYHMHKFVLKVKPKF